MAKIEIEIEDLRQRSGRRRARLYRWIVQFPTLLRANLNRLRAGLEMFLNAQDFKTWRTPSSRASVADSNGDTAGDRVKAIVWLGGRLARAASFVERFSEGEYLGSNPNDPEGEMQGKAWAENLQKWRAAFAQNPMTSGLALEHLSVLGGNHASPQKQRWKDRDLARSSEAALAAITHPLAAKSDFADVGLVGLIQDENLDAEAVARLLAEWRESGRRPTWDNILATIDKNRPKPVLMERKPIANRLAEALKKFL